MFSHLLVAQRSRRFEGGGGAQAAERPGLGGPRGLQGSSDGRRWRAEVGEVGGGAHYAERLTLILPKTETQQQEGTEIVQVQVFYCQIQTHRTTQGQTGH